MARKVTERYLKPLLKKDIDTLILGCTHYPLLKKILRRVTGKKVEFIDSARETARQAKKILEQKGLTRNNNSLAKCRFFVSDEPAVFKKVGKRFLGKRISLVKKCTL